MSYRTGTVYVQGSTLSRLRLVRKMYPHHLTEAVGVVDTRQREATIDEIADKLINDAIERDYPDAIALEKNIARVEAEAMEKAREKARTP